MPKEAPQKIEEDPKSNLSRREFLKDAGLVVGGATVGSMALLNACSGGTNTVTNTATVTNSITKTVTSTVAGPGGAVITVTQPGTTVTAPSTSQAAQTAPAGTIALTINGATYVLKVEPEWSLAFVIRKKLGLIGTKVACDRGECGLCTVLVDDTPVLACCIPACEAEGMNITTVEGLATGAKLHPVQEQFLDVFQCGYCTPAMILTTIALYKKYPNPTALQARESISGNLCWCGDQSRILGLIMKNPVRCKRGL